MKKRPLSIVLIALFYCLEPIGNLVQAAYINDLPLLGEGSILSRLFWADWIILGLFPVVGLSIYLVKRWSWYLFLAFSGLLIFYNIIVYRFLNPNYSLATVLFFILMTTAVTAFFLRKNVYAPYFNPRLRWWETATRYRATLTTVLTTSAGAAPCLTQDISETGCFIHHPGAIALGDQVMLAFAYDGMVISCMGKVVHHRSGTEGERTQGYGIIFQAIPAEMKKRIRQLLWHFERCGLEDREDRARQAEEREEIPWQEYTLFDQTGFRVKRVLRTALGTA